MKAVIMLPRKTVIVLLILSVALPILLVRQQRLARANQAIIEAHQMNYALEAQMVEIVAQTDSVRRRLQDERRELLDKQAALRRAEQEVGRVAPEARWATPPAHGPEWEENSPYLWVHKTALRMLGNPLKEDGELRTEAAETLALEPGIAKSLNARLAGLLTQYRALEAQRAERIDEPLPGITGDGPQLTVRVSSFPEEGERLKREFLKTLHDALGAQRAGLVLQGAAGWLDSQFAVGGSEPKTISVVRHPDGTYNLSMRSGESWFSTGGFKDLGEQVPDHLLPLFTEIMEPQPEGQ